MKSRHEKIFRRENGLRVKIEVKLISDYARDKVWYSTYVSVAEPRKRNFRSPLNDDERATASEIYASKCELHDKIRPFLNNTVGL